MNKLLVNNINLLNAICFCILLTLSPRKHEFHKLRKLGASLLAQWLRICLRRQGTRVRALVREDPTCRGATKPMRHNY